jgi:hypothetical protein
MSDDPQLEHDGVVLPEEDYVEEWMQEIIDDVTHLEYLDSHLDAEKVNWIVNNMANWRAEQQRREETHAKAIKRLENKIRWFDMKFGPALREWAQQQLIGSKAKSVDLDCGVRLKFTTSRPKFEVLDEEAALAWAKAQGPQFYRVKVEETLNKKVVNAECLASGEVPDGMQFVAPASVFAVDLPKLVKPKAGAP